MNKSYVNKYIYVNACTPARRYYKEKGLIQLNDIENVFVSQLKQSLIGFKHVICAGSSNPFTD